jgi:hypothetical protein
MFVPALIPGNEGGVCELYRQTILEVSAAAVDEMTQLDHLMRQEMARISTVLPNLIADQEPVDFAGKARAKRNILTRLQGTPFINDSNNWSHPQQMPPGCLAMLVTWAIFLLSKFFKLLT